MKLLYQIHNVGIFIYEDSSEWSKKIIENLKVQFEGFEIYNGICPIDYRLIIKNMSELKQRDDAIVVPECSYYYTDGTMRSEYAKVAYKIEDSLVLMWADSETWYAPFLLEILFHKQGITFVHGAGVAIDNSYGELLLAFGGIGKTCFIANAINKDNVSLLGDDLILVSKSGELFSYPRPFCLYEYHKDLFPQFFSKNNVKFVHIKKDQYVRRFFRGLKKIFNVRDNNIYSFLPVSPTKLFSRDKIQLTPVKIDCIYVLRRHQGVNKVNSFKLDSSLKVSNFALNVILHEWDVGLKIILNRHAQSFTNIREYITSRYEILFEAFSKANNLYCVDIPEKLSSIEVSKELNNLIIEGRK